MQLVIEKPWRALRDHDDIVEAHDHAEPTVDEEPATSNVDPQSSTLPWLFDQQVW